MTRKEQIEEFIKFHAHKFSVRNGYETIEELMREMAQWCDNNPKSPWISVEDRLPEVGKLVFVHENNGNTPLPQVAAIDEKRKWIEINGSRMWCDAGKVTHWMPIPQIKKGE